MRACLLSLLLLFLALNGRAQLPTPPSQPTSGPGGSTYAYPSTQSFGPFYSTPGSTEPYTEYYIFEPGGGSVPANLPVVLLLHAFLLKLEGNLSATTRITTLTGSIIWFRTVTRLCFPLTTRLWNRHSLRPTSLLLGKLR